MKLRSFLLPSLAVLLVLLTACAAPEPTPEETATTEEPEAISVTVYEPSTDRSSSLELLGTVVSERDISLSPSTNGQITSINVREGDTVKAGDVLFVLGGTNGTEHPALVQQRTAQVNYDAALASYNTALESGDVSIQLAQLQLESAQNQAEAASIDFYGIAESIDDSKDSIALIRTNLEETHMKNVRDLNNLLEAIDDLEDDKRDAVNDLEDAIDEAPDEETEEMLEDQLEETKDQFDDQIEQMEDQFETLRSGAILSENQLLAQLQQAEAQQHSLVTTQDSTGSRLGLNDGIQDSVELAQQSLAAAVIQSAAARTQAQSQLDLARLNLETAFDQQRSLLVQAPVSGVVHELDVSVGDTVSPQTRLASIVNSGSYALEVGVDIQNAEKLRAGDTAEVEIGGTFMELPIMSVAPNADVQSRLVKVRIQLPNITFRENQTITVRLPLNTVTNNADSFFLPLDAVTIGSHETFVYVVRNGEARQVNVELGVINGPLVEIVDGLSRNDEVIVEGAKEVNEGQPVNVQ